MNWFDLVILVIVLVTAIRGYISGLIMQLASLVGIVLGAIFAGKLSEIVAPKLISLTDIPSHILGPVSYIISFLIILIIIILLGRALQSFIEVIKINTLNRLAGAIFCCAKWLVIISILLNLLAEFDQSKQIIKEDIRENSLTYPLVSEIAQIVIPYLRFDWLT
ncbi:MAG: CvpA family protein [Dysgonomonas sp.]|nr:CvpA family protein [Dysgonomonas sp.]